MTAEAVRRGIRLIPARARRAAGPGPASGRSSAAVPAASAGPSRVTAAMPAASSGSARAISAPGPFCRSPRTPSTTTPAAAPRPISMRTGCGQVRSAWASRTALAGLVRAARRAASSADSRQAGRLIAQASSANQPLLPAVDPAGSRPCDASALTAAMLSSVPGR